MSQRQTKVDVWNAFTLDMIGVQVDGEIVFINTVGAKLLGAVCPKQVVGKPVMDFIHPDCRELVAQRVRQVTGEGVDVPPSREKWVRLDGTVIDLDVVFMPLDYHDKRAVQFIARDATSRKQSQRALP